MERTNRSFIGLLAWPVLAFVVSEAMARALGVRFADNTLGTLYQYLDPEILRNDLTRGLYYLHAQPPLFNLFLGGVLKLFPGVSRAAFSVLFGLTGLALLAGMAWLMERLGVPRTVNAALCLVTASTPNFIVYRHWLFYTLPVAFLLLTGAILLARYVETGRAFFAHGFSWCAAILMMTRAVYHPVWLLAVLAVVALLLGRPRRKTLPGFRHRAFGGDASLVSEKLRSSGKLQRQLLAGYEFGQALAPFPGGDGGSLRGRTSSIGLASKTFPRAR